MHVNQDNLYFRGDFKFENLQEREKREKIHTVAIQVQEQNRMNVKLFKL